MFEVWTLIKLYTLWFGHRLHFPSHLSSLWMRLVVNAHCFTCSILGKQLREAHLQFCWANQCDDLPESSSKCQVFSLFPFTAILTRNPWSLVANIPRLQDKRCSYGKVPNKSPKRHRASCLAPSLAKFISSSWRSLYQQSPC